MRPASSRQARHSVPSLVAMAPTDQLSESFFDLWHHLDPVAAARFDPEAPPLGIAAHDQNGVRQHLAALRALGFAVEELDLEQLEDEVDRTLLLGAIRGLEHRFARGGPYRRNPAFWLDRLCAVLAGRAADPEMVREVAPALSIAEQTLTRPAPELVELGLELAGDAQALLEREGPAATADGPRAGAGLAEFAGFLRHELAADSDPRAGALGSDPTDWTLHYLFGLEADGARALRQLARMAEGLEAELDSLAAEVAPGRAWREIVAADPGSGWSIERALGRLAPFAVLLGPDAPAGGVRVAPLERFRTRVVSLAELRLRPAGALDPERVELGLADRARTFAEAVAARWGPAGAAGALICRGRARSAIRRRYLAPGWLEGFGLFALEMLGPSELFEDPATRLAARALAHQAVVEGAADLGVHLGQLTPAEARHRLAAQAFLGEEWARAAVRGVLMEPLQAAGAALVWREWAGLAAEWAGGAADLIPRVVEAAVFDPAAARWRLGVGS